MAETKVKLTHEEANRRVRAAMIPPVQPDIMARFRQAGQEGLPKRVI